MEIRELLQAYKKGLLSEEEAARALTYSDLGFAKVDRQRSLRCGLPEVIYCEGKTDEQILRIFEDLRAGSCKTALGTRLAPERARWLEGRLSGLHYFEKARIALLGEPMEEVPERYVVVATGGTSDIPVAEEAAVTAAAFGARVERCYDVGVAGLHRLLSKAELIAGASAVVAVAGMEGALASVVAGLAPCPVLAVPTSVGYGASFGGLSALLTMLNSCASGVSVVNIDNGFGAGYQAALINRIGVKNSEDTLY